MMVRVASLLFTVALSSIAQAQQKAPPDLTPVQAEGRAIFSKSCTICHLPPQLPLLKRRLWLPLAEAEAQRLRLQEEGGYRRSEPLF